MKKIFSILTVCAALLSLSSCYDTMDDKSKVEAGFAQLDAPNASVVSATSTDFQTVVLNLGFENFANALEVGAQIATQQDFSDGSYVAADSVSAEYELTISDLEELTTYYVRPYAYVGTQILHGEALQVTTLEKADPLPLSGKYAALDYSYDSDAGQFNPGEANYGVTFELQDDDETVAVYNLWEGGEIVYGYYDEENGTITIPSGQTIYQSPDYGPCVIVGMNDDLSATTETVVITFDAYTGAMESSFYYARIAEGGYAGYRLGRVTATVLQRQGDLE